MAVDGGEAAEALPAADRVAWVTLVMKGDAYVPGALTMAFTVRRTQTRGELVCMVTPDVSALARSQYARSSAWIGLTLTEPSV